MPEEPPEFVFISTPRGRPPDAPPVPTHPSTLEEWQALSTMSEQALREMGMLCWCGPRDTGDPNEDWPHDRALFLFPENWHPHIPDGLALVTIMGRGMVFERGVDDDDDVRVGCLSYGVLAAPR